MASNIVKYCLKNNKAAQFSEIPYGIIFKRPVTINKANNEIFEKRMCSVDSLNNASELHYYVDTNRCKVISNDVSSLEKYIAAEQQQENIFAYATTLWIIICLCIAFISDGQRRYRKQN